MKRVGVFGGSFDPPHVGHVHVAQQAADQLGLDSVYWIPALQSPFKGLTETTSADHRVAMVSSMMELDPRFQLDLRELEMPPPSYTVETLRSLKRDMPEAELFLLIGEDSYQSLHKWKDPEQIRALARVAVYRRRDTRLGSARQLRSDLETGHDGPLDGVHDGPLDGVHDGVHDGAAPQMVNQDDVLLAGEPVSCSSTDIRALASKKNRIDHLVVPKVATYIKMNNLYQNK